MLYTTGATFFLIKNLIFTWKSKTNYTAIELEMINFDSGCKLKSNNIFQVL